MMKKERSIFRMILTAMLVVLGLEVLLLLLAFYFSNMGPQMNQNAMDIVEKTGGKPERLSGKCYAGQSGLKRPVGKD